MPKVSQMFRSPEVSQIKTDLPDGHFLAQLPVHIYLIIQNLSLPSVALYQSLSFKGIIGSKKLFQKVNMLIYKISKAKLEDSFTSRMQSQNALQQAQWKNNKTKMDKVREC